MDKVKFLCRLNSRLLGRSHAPRLRERVQPACVPSATIKLAVGVSSRILHGRGMRSVGSTHVQASHRKPVCTFALCPSRFLVCFAGGVRFDDSIGMGNKCKEQFLAAKNPDVCFLFLFLSIEGPSLWARTCCWWTTASSGAPRAWS